MLITSEIKDSVEHIYNVYKNLWRIEESFRILKTNLSARPIYASKKESIYGHFLVCYTALFLMRIVEFKTLKDKVPANKLFEFVRKFEVVKCNELYINLLTKNEDFCPIIDAIKLPVDNFYLDKKVFEQCLNLSI